MYSCTGPQTKFIEMDADAEKLTYNIQGKIFLNQWF